FCFEGTSENHPNDGWLSPSPFRTVPCDHSNTGSRAMVVTGTRRRSLAIVVIVSTTMLGLVLVGAPSGHATPAFSFTRYAGTDRYDTAAKLATGTFDKSDVVL